MAAAVAVKTGVLQQLTLRAAVIGCVTPASPPNFNAASVLSHARRVCTPLDRVGRGSRPRQLHPSPGCDPCEARTRRITATCAP
jgi:hypothetical protein